MSSVGTKFILAQQFVFDPNNNTLFDQLNSDGEVIRLGSNESRILLLLVENPNMIISRDELHEHVWRKQGFQVDDSSLTQAISTLRKILQDSIKSPRFIKTVPKRGYQLISPVEQAVLLASSKEPEANEVEVSNGLDTADLSEENSTNNDVRAIEPSARTHDSRFKKYINPKIILIISVLLPLAAFMFSPSTPSEFKHVATVEEIPVLTTPGQPPIDDWQPFIRSCIESYVRINKVKPVKVVTTAGTNHNLILNYVYSEANSIDNETIQLIAKQKELSELCE